MTVKAASGFKTSRMRETGVAPLCARLHGARLCLIGPIQENSNDLVQVLGSAEPLEFLIFNRTAHPVLFIGAIPGDDWKLHTVQICLFEIDLYQLPWIVQVCNFNSVLMLPVTIAFIKVPLLKSP
jgi:hypothetical protein